MKNQLLYGDNLDMLARIGNQSIDLIYLDPPFNSSQDYNVLFKEHNGVKATAQIRAFEDTWTWDDAAAEAYDEALHEGGRLADALVAFRSYLGTSDMLAYLAMMAPRLTELRRVLKPTGSIYLHCDATAGHYLKVLMDAVFEPQNFRSEIIWKRTSTHSDAKRWSPVHDIILFYSNGARPIWHAPHVPHDENYVATKYKYRDHRGVYRLDNMTSPKPRPNMMYEWKGYACPPNGWRYSKVTMAKLDREGRIQYPASKAKRPQLKRYLHEVSGMLMGDVWTDIAPLNSQAAERLGYPTQKPLALLERIIAASSDPGAVVLDPFCGCGTTVDAAEKLDRKWIGIDITYLAVKTIKDRLKKVYGDRVEYEEHGEPTTMQEAVALAALHPLDFQSWVMTKLRGTPMKARAGADRGIDDRIYFYERSGGEPKQIIVSVKGGHTSVSHLRDLRGVVSRERAAIGVLVTLQAPTKAMLREVADGSWYESPWGNYPKLQLITVEELLAGKTILYPNPRGANARKPRRRKASTATQAELPLLTAFEGGRSADAKADRPAAARTRRRRA